MEGFCQTMCHQAAGDRKCLRQQQQLTQNEEADALLNHQPSRGGILALLLCPILSSSLCASMPKSHSALHQHAIKPPPPPLPSQSQYELMHATEAVTSVVYCLVGRSSL